MGLENETTKIQDLQRLVKTLQLNKGQEKEKEYTMTVNVDIDCWQINWSISAMTSPKL